MAEGCQGIAAGKVGQIDAPRIKSLTRRFFYVKKSITIEEERTISMIQQMTENNILAEKIGISSEEQKKAISNSTRAIEELNKSVFDMAREIDQIVFTTQFIHKSAVDLLNKNEKLNIEQEHV